MNTVKTVLFLLCALYSSFADCGSLNSVNHVEVSDNGEILLHFSGNVEQSQLKVEYFNDSIQVSIDDATLYPSKIIPIEKSWVRKVFVYQYTANQVRCRISVKDKGTSFKDQIEVLPTGKVVHIRPIPGLGTEDARKISIGDELEEDQLLGKVLASTGPQKPQLLSNTSSSQTSQTVLATGKPLPPIGPVALKLLFILALFGCLILIFKNYKKIKWTSNLGAALSSASGYLKKSGGKLGEKPIVEVLSNHYLGSRKSLTLVRVAGRVLVLGVTDGSIQMLTEIAQSNPVGADTSDFSDFSEILNSEQLKPSGTPLPRSEGNLAGASGSVRNRIRDRLENLKPL